MDVVPYPEGMADKRKVSRTFCLEVDQIESLKRLNEVLRVPQAELVRQAIDSFLEHHVHLLDAADEDS